MAPRDKNLGEIRLGESVKVPDPSGLAVLPDGTVVTCRKAYRVEHLGEHRIGHLVFLGVPAEDPEPEPEPEPEAEPEA